MQKNKIIIITGPTASGKTTVAKLLCKKYKKCVRLDIDRVKHFVESGFKYDDSKEGIKQWQLCTENVILLTKNYLKAGYVVIMEGVLWPKENWQKIFKEFSTRNRFLLTVPKKDLYSRNKTRDKKFRMLKKDIDEHIADFSGKFYKKYFGVIKNNNLNDTVQKIAKISSKKR